MAKTEIKKLLVRLDKTKDQSEKRGIRKQLRDLGHRGELKTRVMSK